MEQLEAGWLRPPASFPKGGGFYISERHAGDFVFRVVRLSLFFIQIIAFFAGQHMAKVTHRINWMIV